MLTYGTTTTGTISTLQLSGWGRSAAGQSKAGNEKFMEKLAEELKSLKKSLAEYNEVPDCACGGG